MSTRVRFTTSDLELLPDRLDDQRYEIIDGELFVSKQPRMEHQLVCSKVIQALENWNDQAQLGGTPTAPGLIFTPYDNVAPDASPYHLRESRGHDSTRILRFDGCSASHA